SRAGASIRPKPLLAYLPAIWTPRGTCSSTGNTSTCGTSPILIILPRPAGPWTGLRHGLAQVERPPPTIGDGAWRLTCAMSTCFAKPVATFFGTTPAGMTSGGAGTAPNG